MYIFCNLPKIPRMTFLKTPFYKVSFVIMDKRGKWQPNTVKPQNSGHLQVIKICSLLRGVRCWEVV